jgi:hypothetical protein
MIHQEAALRWGLIFVLAALGLVRPLLSILGAYENLEGLWGPILVTIFIAAIWVGVVVGTGAPNPLATLVLVGASYGLFAIVLQQLTWNLFLEAPPKIVPSSTPILVASWLAFIVTNTIWGAVLGSLRQGCVARCHSTHFGSAPVSTGFREHLPPGTSVNRGKKQLIWGMYSRGCVG